MKKISREKIDKIKPEDAIPLLLRLRRLLLGRKKPDGFTSVVFTINLIGAVLLSLWNLLSYFVIIMSDFIKQHKGFSVNEIIRRNGRNLGFEGQDFLDTITQFYFINNFVWIAIIFGILLLYRRKKTYIYFYFGGFIVHFLLLIFWIGLQYFIEDVTLFDKLIYAAMIISTLLHAVVFSKNKTDEGYDKEERII